MLSSCPSAARPARIKEFCTEKKNVRKIWSPQRPPFLFLFFIFNFLCFCFGASQGRLKSAWLLPENIGPSNSGGVGRALLRTSYVLALPLITAYCLLVSRRTYSRAFTLRSERSGSFLWFATDPEKKSERESGKEGILERVKEKID